MSLLELDDESDEALRMRAASIRMRRVERTMDELTMLERAGTPFTVKLALWRKLPPHLARFTHPGCLQEGDWSVPKLIPQQRCAECGKP